MLFTSDLFDYSKCFNAANINEREEQVPDHQEIHHKNTHVRPW